MAVPVGEIVKVAVDVVKTGAKTVPLEKGAKKLGDMLKNKK